ncbi:hypothetical protein CEXT_505791 [Caerostris extrusa]|uniref:Uncharacterized protein n=1 Tax=Caerostris extrusa TaxID=172846 RepID=A0AAV4MGI0_CAEEX|nr:hypothetical protein CEXT_505791 [Caerostris extrusa]
MTSVSDAEIDTVSCATCCFESKVSWILIKRYPIYLSVDINFKEPLFSIQLPTVDPTSYRFLHNPNDTSIQKKQQHLSMQEGSYLKACVLHPLHPKPSFSSSMPLFLFLSSSHQK